jgi:hypothetical protein
MTQVPGGFRPKGASPPAPGLTFLSVFDSPDINEELPEELPELGAKEDISKVPGPQTSCTALGNRVKGKREWLAAAARRPAGNRAFLWDWGYIYGNQ